jgi:BirA family biotin operon repressor/biotin-[acetyl-CoA-carboxylase] ligase
LAVGLAVIYAVEDLLSNQQGKLRLKWANDVLIEERKLAGILCEATSRSSSGNSRVVVGIGLNRCIDFAQVGLAADRVGNAISLHQISSMVPEELSLLERLRHYLMQVSAILSQRRGAPDSSGIAAFLPELHQRDILRDRSVILELVGEHISGQAVGFDPQGRLLLRLPNDEVKAFASGRVIWWGVGNQE